MNKFWTVFSYTFSSKIKSKSFIITTALFIGFIFLLSNIDSLVDAFGSEEEGDKIAVVTEQEGYYQLLQESTTDELTLESYEGTLEDAQSDVLNEEFQGVLEIRESAEGLPEATYYGTDNLNQATEGMLTAQLQQIKVAEVMNQAGIDEGTLAALYEPVAFDQEMMSAEGDSGTAAKSEEERMGATMLVYVILFLLYFAVIAYGNMIAMDIANEKTSRVMEILISSSSPISQMFAKILGIGLAGLTQMLLLFGAGYFMLVQQDENGMLSDLGLNEVSAGTFIYAIIFFILGYFLYATLAAMLGSLVSRTEDVQQLMMPVTLLIVAAFVIAMMGLGMPESGLVVVSSFIPFFAPMTMFLRVGLLDIPFWEIAVSIGILVASILVLAWLGAKIYRGGVLMYGSSTSLKDFKKALQLSKK
ncbi:ABC transporter permease [Gracilibacillus alcaliphilus]|uniref:ABC transporter permease n=1 Tax=Gracilibacillus alcaliphilus TaxID=1401441 RepID=UPI00195DC073|nr:ABC transporter permease [Gracilibacillus alcaliphilus]MBM7675398.1 ABC-2 type transport system permease protein [Gracilibacillus alcaliphilus]